MKNKLSKDEIRQRFGIYGARLRKTNEKTLRISKTTAGNAVANLLTYIALAALTVVFLAPFIYMIVRSVMSSKDLADAFVVTWVPRSFVFENYVYAFKVLDYIPRLLRSLLIAGGSALAQVMTSAFVAYGLARIKFRGSNLLFVLVIFSLIVPPQTVIIAQYLLFAQVGFTNSAVPYVLPCLFALGLNGGLFVFLFRQAFKGMPEELENAAMIDGTNLFTAYFRVMLPNASSTILVSVILSFIWQWNNYFEPSIYINSTDQYTLVMMLQNLSSVASKQYGMSNFTSGVNLAATFLCALPVIIIFFILQKRFMKGIETTGLAN